MEILEVVAGTFGHVYSAIKVTGEIKEELENLSDTIESAEAILRPLRSDDEKVRLPTDTVDLFVKLEQTIEQAKESSKRIAESQQRKSAWAVPASISNIFTLRPMKDVDELKGLSEKIKSLSTFLSASLIHARTKVPLSNASFGNRETRRLSVEAARKSKSSLADSVIEHQEAKLFWTKHVGPDEYEVSWKRFIDAVRHEFFSGSPSSRSIRRHSQFFEYFRDRIDATGENEVTIYAWAQFAASAENQTLEETFKLLMQEAETNEYRSPLLQIGSNPPQKPQNGPTVASTPEKIKSRVLMRATTEIFPPAHQHDSFELEIFGDAAVVSLPALAALQIIRPSGDVSAPRIELGRSIFQALPSKYLVHISRQHCVIESLRHGSLSSSTSLSASATPGFQITDVSGNGTFLNGKKMQKNRPVPLQNGDKITILTHPRGSVPPSTDPTLLGFVFRDLRQASPAPAAIASQEFTSPFPKPVSSQLRSSPRRGSVATASSRAFLSHSEMIGVTNLLDLGSQLSSPMSTVAEEDGTQRRMAKKRKSSVSSLDASSDSIEASLLEIPRPKRTKTNA